MIISTKKGTPQEELQKIISGFEAQGLEVTLIRGTDYNVFGLVGDTTKINDKVVAANPWVESVTRVSAPYKKANRLFHAADTIVDVAGVKVGGKENVVVIGGPCSVECEQQAVDIAKAVKAAGGKMLRGGAYKPRTSPYAFQGLRGHGLELLLEARRLTGLPVVTEIMDLSQLPLFDEVDVIQVGARNMQNFELLKELGHTGKPILIKRGLANTLQELLMSAEYVMAGGNEKVILCERGIRTFETATRNTLDLSAVPMLKKLTHLPVIVDPSHATGISWMVKPMALAATAAGADGLMIEVHNDPGRALCDGAQSLTPEAFRDVMDGVRAVLPHAWHMPKEGV